MTKKIVLVTGASSGIGKAAALRMAEKGFHVLAGVRKVADAEAWKKVPNARAVFFDVTDDSSVASAMKELSPELKKASEVHLVNNAGIAVAGPVEAVSMTRWREQFEVNVLGLVRASQALLPFVRATKGRVVNISSVSGISTLPYLGPYSASKFAVEAISDALRRELRQFDAKVVVVEPGPISTPIWEKNLGKKDLLVSELDGELREAYGRELARFQKGVEKSARDAVNVNVVSDAIEKALTVPNPRTRYVVGPKGIATQMAVAALLPDKWIDSLVAREFSPRE